MLLLGLVLIADAPGRLPHALRQLAALVAGGVPAVWSLPWIEAWRVGEPAGPQNAPKVVRQLLEDLRAMTEARRLGERQPKRGGVMLHLLTLAVINPGQGVAPPGSDKLLTILRWTAWGVFAICVAGVLTSGARLAIAHNQGYGGGHQHAMGLVWSLLGAVIAGSLAASIVTVLS